MAGGKKVYGGKKDNWLILIVLILIAAVFIKTYYPHTGFRFPYHHDEWQHLALSVQAADLGYNSDLNPYTGEKSLHKDLEPGFHLFLAFLFTLTGIDPVLSFQYLAASAAGISALLVFVCISRLAKSRLAGLISVLVFLSLKSNINILGTIFFVPMSMAIPFIFAYIFLFIRGIDNKEIKNLAASFFVLCVLFFIHPPSFMLLFLPSLAEAAFSKELRKYIGNAWASKAGKYRIFAFFAIFVLFASLGFLLIWKGSVHETRVYLGDLLYFEKGWGKHEITFFIPYLYGLVPTLLGLYGFFIELKKGQSLRIFSFMFFFSLAVVAMFNSFGFTVLLPYSRAVHYAMLSMLPLTATGLLAGIVYFKETVKKRFGQNLTLVASSSLVLLFLAGTFIPEYPLNTQYQSYSFPVMDEADYKALVWARENIKRGEVLVVPYFMSSAVYPVSLKRVISLVAAPLEGGDTEENIQFYTQDCGYKQDILEKTGAAYVLSRNDLDCSFFEEAYLEGRYIYKVNFS